MFGYVKPFRPELRLRELTQYQTAYCGLCRALSERYGAFARLLVNYDFVFLLMLFWSGPYGTVKRRCVRHPFRGRCQICENPALNYAADALMLFTGWKLRDTVADARLALFSRFLLLFYRGAFRRAAERLPREAEECGRRMGEIRRIEGGGAVTDGLCGEVPEESYGAAADGARGGTPDAFGSMLACLSGFFTDEGDRRAAGSLLFHLGRWVTLADAAEDRERDGKSGAYNAVTASGLEREAVFRLLGREQERALAASDLIPENVFSGITRNILTLGLQARGHDLYRKGER
ncbi:MAG: DUF5685 family protein [Oscillospiraceae bacterium]|jgi:hypothetical protein|nr:DUF5685 family protein [Oscillospiraceae bacterium]